MLRVSLVITVRSSTETAGLKLSMRTMASPGDESETNSTEQGACWHPHLQITWIKVLQQAVESTEEDHSQGGHIHPSVQTTVSPHRFNNHKQKNSQWLHFLTDRMSKRTQFSSFIKNCRLSFSFLPLFGGFFALLASSLTIIKWSHTFMNNHESLIFASLTVWLFLRLSCVKTTF